MSERATEAARQAVPLCAPLLHGNEWAYIKDCLDTNWVSSAGSFVTRFEREVAQRVGAQAAVACSSGTAALHLALLVAGVRFDDEVIVPALTFIAPANAVRYLGGHPVFVDVEAASWQVDVAKLSQFIACTYEPDGSGLRNRRTGRRASALITVDALGHPADADAIVALAKACGLRTIEDATESLGALYKSRPAGTLMDVGCLSFNGNKIVTTGGGGMLLTDNPEWAERARYLSMQAKDDAVEQIHGTVGFNYRLTNIQAALGVAQMEYLDHHVAAKRRIAAEYIARLSDVPGICWQQEAPWARATYWMWTALIDESITGVSGRTVLRRLMSDGIECRPLWQPLHRSPAHAGAIAAVCDVADQIAHQAVSLPSSVGLSAADQSFVIRRFLKALGHE